jgi:hypothetical protein
MRLREGVLEAVNKERDRQETKWDIHDHNSDHWLAILGKEFGEACKASLKNNMLEYKMELIQIAAVAVAAVESLLRQAGEKGGEVKVQVCGCQICTLARNLLCAELNTTEVHHETD